MGECDEGMIHIISLIGFEYLEGETVKSPLQVKIENGYMMIHIVVLRLVE